MKNIKTTFAILVFVFAIAATSTAFAQGARNLGYDQSQQKCGPGSKSARCSADAQQTDVNRVWQLTGATPQEFDIPRKLESGLEIHYSKNALGLMQSWDIEEEEDLDGIALTRIADDSVARLLMYEGGTIPNRAVYVVRLDKKTPRGTLLELRIVMFEQGGTVSQVRIFDGGRAYQDVAPARRK